MVGKKTIQKIPDKYHLPIHRDTGIFTNNASVQSIFNVSLTLKYVYNYIKYSILSGDLVNGKHIIINGNIK